MGRLLQLAWKALRSKVGPTVVADEAGAIKAAWSAVERESLTGLGKVAAVAGESAGSVVNFFKAIPGKIWGHKVLSTGVGVVGTGSYQAHSWWENVRENKLYQLLFGDPSGKGGSSSGLFPWLLAAAAVGGLFLAFKDRIFGKSEAQWAAPDVTPPARTLSPAEQLMQPQLTFPQVPMGGNVTAAYPAIVGNVAPQVAPPAPPPETRWRAAVGGQKPSVAAGILPASRTTPCRSSRDAAK